MRTSKGSPLKLKSFFESSRRDFSKRTAASAGYTTVEMLVALAIFLMLGTIGIAAFSGGDRAQLKADASDLALALQTARLTALESGQNIPIRVNTDQSYVEVNGRIVQFSRGVTLASDQEFLMIHPSGTSDGLRLDLQKRDNRVSVELDWLTGRVEIIR